VFCFKPNTASRDAP